MYFFAAWSQGRGRIKTCKSVGISVSLHSGSHGSYILCAGSHIHVDQRSDCSKRSTNLSWEKGMKLIFYSWRYNFSLLVVALFVSYYLSFLLWEWIIELPIRNVYYLDSNSFQESETFQIRALYLILRSEWLQELFRFKASPLWFKIIAKREDHYIMRHL